MNNVLMHHSRDHSTSSIFFYRMHSCGICEHPRQVKSRTVKYITVFLYLAVDK